MCMVIYMLPTLSSMERQLLIDFDWGGKEGRRATFPDDDLLPILSDAQMIY